MSIDPDTFRSVLGRFASGVTIITTRDENGQDHGMTVSAFSALSLTPPMVLACIDRSAGMYHVLQRTGFFTVNILSSPQEALSRRFELAQRVARRVVGRIDLDVDQDFQHGQRRAVGGVDDWLTARVPPAGG